MGGQNTKQIQADSPVQIDHPRFENARVSESKGDLSMITTMSIEEKEYNKWKQELSAVKGTPDYLLMPKSHQFSTKGFCGSTGTLTVAYEYFPYLLIEEIENRKKRKSKFQQCQLWFLLFSLSAAQIEMKKIFDCKVGDFRPQNIFISQEGNIKASCLYSWPRETSNFEKTFQRVQTLLSPEDMNKLELGGMDDIKNYSSEMFSIGMTILNAALLNDFTEIYDVKKFKFKFDEASEHLQEWRNNTVYSEIFTAFISNLCSFEPEKRLTEKELWSWINKHEEEIKNKEDFFIDHAPLKIEKEIQQMRGESNINMLEEPAQKIPSGMLQSTQQHQIPFQERSVVYPFMQGLPEQRFAQQPPANMQRTIIPPLNTAGMNGSQHPNMIMSPREGIQQHQMMPMMQSIHHNIPTAESMYAQIPGELMQKQYVTMAPGQFGQISSCQMHSQFQGQQLSSQFQGQLPQHLQGQLPQHLQGQLPQHLQGQLPGGMMGSLSGQQTSFSGVQRVVSPQQQYLPPNMMPMPQTSGNFVYTRRIIDPTNHSVVAEERIGQDEYHRGIGNIDEPEDADY